MSESGGSLRAVVAIVIVTVVIGGAGAVGLMMARGKGGEQKKVLRRREPPPPPDVASAEYGRKMFIFQGCATCHTTREDGPRMQGPSLYRAFGSQVDLIDGTTVTVDEAYLRSSVLDPQAQIRAGFSMPMVPPFPMTDVQIDSLVLYLMSIGFDDEG